MAAGGDAVKATRRAALAAGMGLVLGATAEAAGDARPAEPSRSWRVLDLAARREVAWKDLVARMAGADAVFLGEQHDDPETHRVEAALLSALHARAGRRLVLALEMLERDAQPALDGYLAGRITEGDFAQSVALWPNYATDYRPLVEYARARRLPVRAANAPRRIARTVSQKGLAALDTLAPEERRLVAEFVSAPADDYWRRFQSTLGGEHGSLDAASLRRFYEAQCLKDDTMAETVAQALGDGAGIVLHVNGAFHSAGGRGIPQRVLWRRPLGGARLLVVALVPVRGDVARAETGTYRGEADVAVLVPDRRPAAAEPKEIP